MLDFFRITRDVEMVMGIVWYVRREHNCEKSNRCQSHNPSLCPTDSKIGFESSSHHFILIPLFLFKLWMDKFHTRVCDLIDMVHTRLGVIFRYIRLLSFCRDISQKEASELTCLRNFTKMKHYWISEPNLSGIDHSPTHKH